MGWYRPGRSENHPGDPPPEWAPLSRKTRLALLLTVVAGVVIALMIMSTPSAGATDGSGAPAAGSVLMAPCDVVGPLGPPR